jgi:hypothetical protein
MFSAAMVSSSCAALASSPFVAAPLGRSPDKALADWARLLFSAVAKPATFMMEPSLRESIRVDSTLGLSVRPRRMASREDWDVFV